MVLLAHFALVHRLALILEVTTTEAVNAQMVTPDSLEFVPMRHRLELGARVQRVFLRGANWTAS